MTAMKTEIIMEDAQIIVCRKPAGIAVQTGQIGQQDVLGELKHDGKRPYIGVIHRLDQPVEGLLVFAKTKAAAANLNRQMAENKMVKKYAAAVVGAGLPEAETLVDFLKKDARANRSFVVKKTGQPDASAKRAKLSYRVMSRENEVALIEVVLATGRHHQIRVQMAHRGSPLLGDCKYGNDTSVMLSEKYNVKQTALSAFWLEFFHPATGEKIACSIVPEGSIFTRLWKGHGY